MSKRPAAPALSILLALFLAVSPVPVAAFGGLTGALEDISNQIDNSDSDSNSSNPSSQGSGTSGGGSGTSSTPAPAASEPAGPEFGPADEPTTDPIDSRTVPAVDTDALDGDVTVDPVTGEKTITKTNSDGSKKVTVKDKDGKVLSEEFYPPGATKPDVTKITDPATGITTTTVTNKDGSKDILTTNSDGFITGETHVDAPRPSASMYDPETGTTTTSVRNPDGSRTITKKDKDGNVIATETMPPRGSGGASATITDPKTGQTITSTRNPDGSRTVTTKDKTGKVVSTEKQPAPGQGEAYASSRDPKTGVTTTVSGSGDNKRVSESRSWQGEDGSEHTLVTDNKGGQTEIVRGKDGSTVTTQYDADDKKTVTTQTPDGTKKTVAQTDDGYLEETIVNKDGTSEIVKKDHAGNVLQQTSLDKDGRATSRTDGLGVKSTMKEEADGGYSVERTDASGNKRVEHYDKDGQLKYLDDKPAKPYEPGQAYFENELGGRFGEWDKLPQSAKNQYANSEDQILERAQMELLRKQQEEERLQTEEERKRFNAELQKETDAKLAKIEEDYQKEMARIAENKKQDELLRKRSEAKDKIKDYDRRIYEAEARGDRDEAQRLRIEADKYSESTNEIWEMTPEEEKRATDRQAVRDRLTQRIGSRARNIAESELVATEGVQELKEDVTGKAKYLSIGAEMQEQTKKTTRMADREKVFAEAKQAEIYRMLNDPKTTREEKEVLYEMLEMADLQQAGADRMLSDNATLTAAGYGIDAALLVSGGKLAQLGERGVTAAAGKFLAKETALKVVQKTTQTGVLTLAGEGATKAATTATSRVAGEQAAVAVEKALGYDVGKAAATATESAATRVLGETGVQTVKNAAAKTAEIAGTNVSELPSKLRGTAAATETRAAADAGKSGARSLADTWADDAVPEPVEAVIPKPSNAPTQRGANAAPEPPQYGDRTMPLEALEDYAKNPRVRTAEPPASTVDQFSPNPIRSKHQRPDFVESRKAWKDVPLAERQAFDREVRSAIDEAAAMGDKWAKRVQQDLNSGKIKYEYEPGLNYAGLAPGDGRVILNPLLGNGRTLDSPEKLASTLVHEYAHSYKGPVKWAAQEGRTASGTATKGEYNEVRAFMAEAQFNKNLQNARSLNGKNFDDSALKEIEALIKPETLPAGANPYARGVEARKNLQEGLVDDYSYGKDYMNNPNLAAERLSNYRGGSMTDIRERLRRARGPNGEETLESYKVLQEIAEQGGRTAPKTP